MRILKNAILICSLMSVLVATNSAEALEIFAAWDGPKVDDFDLGYQTPSSADSRVNSAGSGGTLGAGVLITSGGGNLRNIDMALGGYLQFKIQAAAGQTIDLDGFQVSTLAEVGVLTTITYSTDENVGYGSPIGSLATLSTGTNTYDFNDTITLSDGEIGYFRLNATLADIIVFDATQPTPVFAIVPEPSTYAMGAAGIAVLGYAGRNRRKKAAKRSDG